MPDPPRLWLAGAISCVLGLALAMALPDAHSRVGHAPTLPGGRLSSLLALDTSASSVTQTRRIERSGWQGGATTASDGEVVDVNVADSIPDPATVARRWADFFTGLVHGPELQLLTVYVVPGTEVGTDCGGPNVLGCYDAQRLLIPNEPVKGVTPEKVARHEYGHHVANNRLNTPWDAVDWGPKRWATQIGICPMSHQGLVYPGDEDENYKLNPGEIWAETYRVLNETKLGMPVTWPIVDGRFIPDQPTLAVAEREVTTPWVTPVVRVTRARFVKGKKRWTLALPTPLDGDMKVTLTLPRGRVYRLSILTPDAKAVLGTGLWTARTAQLATLTLCGQRSVLVRVNGDGRAGRFTVVTTSPA